MKKKDLILLCVIISAAALMFFLVSYTRSEQGNMVVISVDGQTYGEYNLNENQTVEIETELGINILVVEDGGVYMREADCPDGYCVSQGRIERNSETIICLPHKLVAQVVVNDVSNVSEDEQVVDIIA